MEFLKTVDFLVIFKILIIAFGLGFGIYYAQYMKPFLLWLKGGIENGDGILQNKDLQMASFTAFCGFILITIAFWSVKWPEAIIYSVFGTTAALYGIKNLGQSYVESRKNGDNKNGKNGTNNDSSELG